MDTHPVMQKVRLFERRHGPESFNDGSAIYYADGAVRDVNPLGLLAEPPDPRTEEGEYRLFAAKLKFAKLKLEKAVREFDDLNTRLAHSIPMDPEGDLAQLKRLQKVVEDRKQLVATAEAALAQTAWGKRHAERLRDQEEQRQRMADFHQQRRLIRV